MTSAWLKPSLMQQLWHRQLRLLLQLLVLLLVLGMLGLVVL